MSGYDNDPAVSRGSGRMLGWLAGLLALMVVVGLAWWSFGGRHGLTSSTGTGTAAAPLSVLPPGRSVPLTSLN